VKVKTPKPEKKDDTSPVTIEVREQNESVMILFDKAVAWVAMEPVQALKVAEQIRAEAVGILRSTPKTS
jgi:hypothetical protein